AEKGDTQTIEVDNIVTETPEGAIRPPARYATVRSSFPPWDSPTASGWLSCGSYSKFTNMLFFYFYSSR
ncbi:hypothetical protein SKA94_06695, partial [Enterococcus faecium]